MTTPDQFKRELGIGIQTVTPDILTPTTQSVAGHIKTGDIITRLLRQEATPVPDVSKELVEFADLSVQLHNRIHDEQRDRHLLLGDDAYNSYGKNTKIVGDVTISPAGTEGRWFMNFRTTHVFREQDLRVEVSCFVFNTHSEHLDELYPARESHMVIGEKSGHKQSIGLYKELYERSGGKVSDYLQKQGWTDIGEIWAADIDRHGGFLESTEK